MHIFLEGVLQSNKNKNLMKWLVILPLLGICITALLLVNFFIDFEQENYKEEALIAKKEALINSKIFAKEKVDEIVSFINSQSELLKQEAHDESKRMIDFAYSLISATYEENKHLPKEEILKKIDFKLREIRFFKNLQGYFFVYDMQGTCLMHPATPQREGQNLLHVKDDKGKEFIKEGIALLKQKSKLHMIGCGQKRIIISAKKSMDISKNLNH